VIGGEPISFDLRPLLRAGNWQRAPALCFAPQVFVGMSHQGSQHPVFDLSSHSEVVWDEKPQQLDGEMDDLLECKHTMFKAAIVSTSDAQKVLDEMPSVVLWDEDRSPELHMNSDLLQQLAQGGEDLIGEQNKPTTELFFIDEFCHVHNTSFISGHADDSINEVFTERPLERVIWDDGKASYEQIAAEVQSVSKDTAHKVFHEIATEIMWDEESGHDLNLQGLLQHLALGEETKVSTEPAIDDLLTPVNDQFSMLATGEKRILVAEPTKDDMFLNQQHPQSLQLGRDAVYEAFIEISFEEKVAAKPMKEDTVVQVLLDEMHCENVVWDETSTNLAVVSDVYSCAHAIELDTHDVLTNVSSLPLFLELDAFSAGNMFEGMLNKDIDKDISVGLFQLYQPSTKGAQLEGSSIPLSPINKWSDSGGDLDSVELHMTRAEICQVEASLTDEGNLKYDLGAAGSTHQLPAWSHGISSPGESETQLELYRMSDTQWDPGLCA